MVLRSFADGALFGEVLGEGPPRVLALHGWGRRGADFRGSLQGLPVIALDLPGFGASPPPSEVLGADGYADIVAETLPVFDGPPVLVGHSFGGRVAVCMAASRPDLTGSMVLTGVPLLRGETRKPALSFRVFRSLHKTGIISDEQMEAVRRRRGSADYRAASGVMRDILVKVVNEEYPDQLRALQSSVHMLWGDRDGEVPVGTAVIANDMINQAGGSSTLEVLPGIGHHVPLEAPERLRAEVETLLR